MPLASFNHRRPITEPPRKIISRLGFSEGLKPSYNPIATPKGAVWEGRNLDVDDVGILRQRPGSLTVGTSAGAGGVQGALSAFGTEVIAWDKGIYKLVGATRTLIAGSAGVLQTGQIDLIPWTAFGSQVVYALSGAGLYEVSSASCAAVTPKTPGLGETNLLYDAGTGAQDTTSTPYKARIGLMRPGLSSRMAAAYGNEVCLSAPDDPTWWPSDQVIFLPDDGDAVVALSLFYDALIIYRSRDIWAFFGADVTASGAALTRQHAGVGCLARRSLAQVPGVGEVFLGSDNIYALRGVSGIADQFTPVAVGDDVDTYLKQSLADTTPENAAGIFYGGEYRLCFPNAVQPERVFRLKGKSNWYIDDGPRASAYFVHAGDLYAADPSFGLCRKISGDYATDDGIGIPVSATFAHENLGGEARIKRLYVYASGTKTLQHLGATVIADGKEIAALELSIAAAAGSGFTIGESRIEGPDYLGRFSEMRVYEGRISLKGSFAQVEIVATTSGERLAIAGYALEVRPTGRMKGIRDGVS